MIPGHWLNPIEAEAMNYKLVDNFESNLNKITVSEAMINFSASNIGFIEHKHLIGLRIEGFLLRVRYVIYQIILVSFNQSPIAAALFILLLELAHILTYLYYSIRYRYANNWLLVASKFNIGIGIMIICLISLYISLSNWGVRGHIYNVNESI